LIDFSPVLVNNYLLVEVLSTTQPFYVYKAIDISQKSFDHFISLKTLHPNFLTDSNISIELKEESEALKYLSDPTIPKYYDSGEISGQQFLSYDHVWGKSLLYLLRELRKYSKMLSESYSAYIIAEICAALSHAHSISDPAYPEGIFHLNINPHNIIISYTGEIHIVGFGLKSPTIAGKSLKTMDFRKISYISPKQFSNTNQGVQSDIFSLGAMFYELVTGSPPFMEKTRKSVIKRIAKGSYIPATVVNNQLPDFLNSVFAKSLTPFVSDRFSSIKEFEKSISRFTKKYSSDLTSDRLANLMQSLFKKNISKDIKYFENLVALMPSSRKDFFEDIPQFMVDELALNLNRPESRSSSRKRISSPTFDTHSSVSTETPSSQQSIESFTNPGDFKWSDISKPHMESEYNTFFSQDDSKLVGMDKKQISREQLEENHRRLLSLSDISPPEYKKHQLNIDFIDEPSIIQSSREDTKEIVDTKDNMELLVGKTLGEYQITGIIGWGSTGTVYEGIQPVIGKIVAIKVLKPSFCENKVITQRFLDEAKAVNSIQNPHIIDIYTYGIYKHKYHYLVMEKLNGEDLGLFIQRTKTISFKIAYSIFMQLFYAMREAHEKGIIHRDIKPDNIFLAKHSLVEQYVKVLDFGIAKFIKNDDDKTALTKEGATIGTPLYMSPEQAMGKTISVESDIYSIGVLMYEIFTGSLPFNKKSYIAVLQAHLMDPPPAPSSIRDMDKELEDIILWTLNKKKSDRPSSIKELSERLLPYLKSKINPCDQ
jgi:serine/threonine protein kinase